MLTFECKALPKTPGFRMTAYTVDYNHVQPLGDFALSRVASDLRQAVDVSRVKSILGMVT